MHHPTWHLAELNIARALASLDGPLLADFMSELDRINALADGAPGFVWRLQDGSGNATGVRAGDDPFLIVNLSVWQSAEDLFHFTYRTAHAGVMSQRRKWFEKMTEAYLVLFWVPAGHRPTVEEAFDRLYTLRRLGPTAEAFTLKARFAPPESADRPRT